MLPTRARERLACVGWAWLMNFNSPWLEEWLNSLNPASVLTSLSEFSQLCDMPLAYIVSMKDGVSIFETTFLLFICFELLCCLKFCF